jgi:hypothetical protein
MAWPFHRNGYATNNISMKTYFCAVEGRASVAVRLQGVSSLIRSLTALENAAPWRFVLWMESDRLGRAAIP